MINASFTTSHTHYNSLPDSFLAMHSKALAAKHRRPALEKNLDSSERTVSVTFLLCVVLGKVAIHTKNPPNTESATQNQGESTSVITIGTGKTDLFQLHSDAHACSWCHDLSRSAVSLQSRPIPQSAHILRNLVIGGAPHLFPACIKMYAAPIVRGQRIVADHITR